MWVIRCIISWWMPLRERERKDLFPKNLKKTKGNLHYNIALWFTTSVLIFLTLTASFFTKIFNLKKKESQLWSEISWKMTTFFLPARFYQRSRCLKFVSSSSGALFGSNRVSHLLTKECHSHNESKWGSLCSVEILRSTRRRETP